jgi:hypothetical protein
MREGKRLATDKDHEEVMYINQDWGEMPRYDYDDTPKKPEKPKLRLSYEHIAHMHNKDFERAICSDDFIRKYSSYTNILQLLHEFRSQFGIGPYDPLPEERLS